MKGVIYIDLERCLACRSCEVECAVAHSGAKVLEQAVREDPQPQPRVRVEGAEEFAVPLQCRHCEEAPCVAICPTGAMEKLGPQEPVVIDTERCIGCKWCILVCPFGVLQMDRAGKVIIKCDLCLERIEAGEEPACVVACPTGALQYLSIEEVSARARRRASRDALVAFGKASKIKEESEH